MANNGLKRSVDNRVIAGICGGLAEFFGLSSTVIRIAFLFFALFGVGELVYVIMWIVVPKADRTPPPPPSPGSAPAP